MQKEVY